MVWRITDPQGHEASKIKWELVQYTRGRVLDIGCGPDKAFEHFIGVDNGHHSDNFNWPKSAYVHCHADNLDIFASEHFDAVFSSHLLEHIEDYRAALREWWRVLKVGGHLCLYLPHAKFYPNIGTPEANPDHKHDFMPRDILEAMYDVGFWDLMENQDRSEGKEYSFFQVYRKAESGNAFSCEEPLPERRAAVVRYGAQGDLMQASSIFPGLKGQGFHVTLYCQAGLGHEVIKHDPNIDRIYLQDRDQVPNTQLKDFWSWEAKKYDRFINLSESVEGAWLALPDRVNHSWPHETRKKRLNVNYLEHAHDLAGVPLPVRCKFYATPDEQEWARSERAKMGKKVILWSLAGSSIHKCWPHMDMIIARIMISYKSVDVVMVGDEYCQILEIGWQNEPRIHQRSGKWTVRESMAFCEQADLIIGTETGLLNASALLPQPKIVMLSHSTKENLTKHWKNTRTLAPENTSCYPCHRMHYNWDFCVQVEENGQSLCMNNVMPETVWAAVVECIGPVDVSRESIQKRNMVIRQKPVAGAVANALSEVRIF